MDVGQGIPNWMQPNNKPKRLSLQELQEERKRLTEINRINKLNAERNKILALKRVGGEIVNVGKGGLSKISEFEKSRVKAKPLFESPFKKKSIYD